MSEFTPGQIQEILDIFFDNFAHRQYIGARYVPIFGRKGEESIEWDNTGTYEPLTIVLNEGNSYTSRQFVPVGIDIDNADYWAETGNYNAQVELYRQDVLTFDGRITAIETILPDKVQAFETVSDMQASDDLQAGMICHTNGFHSSGDGGTAFYEITDTGTANGMDVLTCGDLFANLVLSGNEIYISQFGAQSNENCGDIIQRIFNIAQSGNEIVFDVDNINLEKQVHLDVNNVTLRSIPRSYNHVNTAVINDFALLINSHGCTVEHMHFKNSLAASILDISPDEKCIRVVDLTADDFYNIDIEFNGCSFIYYDNCITAYGKNCRIHHCMFSNSINGICFEDKWNGVSTDQRRGLIVENNTFHGGDSSFTNGKTYDQVKTIGVINNGSSRELIVRNNVFNSDYCGYIYKGSDGGLIISGNSCEDHTGILGLAVITLRTDSVVTNSIISNNKLETNASAATHPIVDNPLVFNGNCVLFIVGNYLYGYTNFFRDVHSSSPITFNSNFVFMMANKYGSDGLIVNADSSNHSVALAGNTFNGGTGSMPLFANTGTGTMAATNANYLDCNYINTAHLTTT